ncbi:mitochondrial protein Fmp26 [Cordyceps militaris CM01]|uniref:Altered inheritance of mitochondria protein 24, mitochondrial n=1 Tax=Cordyceps militaris (strain CM01) TaxID=983644 RepID=G3J4H0_CORMM|nr:mitochondrial protein Fmp26 [Cordyceps militaris CM01]EGX96687.1 mitochondrial protein Fmp26 [Cordyceps militaris CM01]
MKGHNALIRPMRGFRIAQPSYICRQCRAIQISAAPSTEAPRGSLGAGGGVFGTPIDPSRDMADARFEVLGSPYSLLSVTLSPSQRLYTRRGTLVALAGNPEDAQSTLSILNPLTRAPLGVPFLYQRISAASPVTALLSTKSPTTTFSVIHLDGTTDWLVAQRNALLAWTGHTLAPSPRMQTSLGVSHWGATLLTGRGLAAVSAPGQVYQLTLAADEAFVAHPGSVVAYSVSRHAPRPFRFKSGAGLRLQVPSVARFLPEMAWLKTVRDSAVYRFVARALFGLRTMARRTIWGDRLFLQFRGPTTILMSSRGVRMADVLSSQEVNEIADAPAGVVQDALEPAAAKTAKVDEPVIKVAEIKQDGKVTFEDGKDLKEFVR